VTPVPVTSYFFRAPLHAQVRLVMRVLPSWPTRSPEFHTGSLDGSNVQNPDNKTAVSSGVIFHAVRLPFAADAYGSGQCLSNPRPCSSPDGFTAPLIFAFGLADLVDGDDHAHLADLHVSHGFDGLRLMSLAATTQDDNIRDLEPHVLTHVKKGFAGVSRKVMALPDDMRTGSPICR